MPAKKGSRELTDKSSNSKEGVTTLVCINVASKAMPPFCVLKGKTVRSVQTISTHIAPPDTVWLIRKTQGCAMNLGLNGPNKIFLKHCGPERPQLFILDSHESHEVLELLESSRQNSIHVLTRPSHTTHILQPLDRVVFSPLKHSYQRSCTEYMSEDTSRTINKVSWPPLLRKAWEETMREELLKKAFEATGIVPLNKY